jgi:hypothetical protein
MTVTISVIRTNPTSSIFSFAQAEVAAGEPFGAMVKSVPIQVESAQVQQAEFRLMEAIGLERDH